VSGFEAGLLQHRDIFEDWNAAITDFDRSLELDPHN